MYSKCTSLHHKINSLSKNPVLWTIKEPISSTLFDAQNAGNRISELLDFKFSWGGMPPDPPRGKGPSGPFKSHSRLIPLQWPLIPNVIETPALVLGSGSGKHADHDMIQDLGFFLICEK